MTMTNVSFLNIPTVALYSLLTDSKYFMVVMFSVHLEKCIVTSQVEVIFPGEIMADWRENTHVTLETFTACDIQALRCLCERC